MDDNVDNRWAFVCSLYGIRKKMSEVLMVPGIVFL